MRRRRRQRLERGRQVDSGRDDHGRSIEQAELAVGSRGDRLLGDGRRRGRLGERFGRVDVHAHRHARDRDVGDARLQRRREDAELAEHALELAVFLPLSHPPSSRRSRARVQAT